MHYVEKVIGLIMKYAFSFFFFKYVLFVSRSSTELRFKGYKEDGLLQ